MFARACELAGDKVRAGEAHADAAYLNGRAEDALNQLKDPSQSSDLTTTSARASTRAFPS